MRLRRATLDDQDLLYQWRQDGEQADWYIGGQTSAQDHAQWFLRRVGNPLVQIWIAEELGEPVGYVRLDSNGEATYYLTPPYRKRGLGATMLTAVCHASDLDKIKAVVDADNQAGADCALTAGFTEHPARLFVWTKP